MANTKTSDLTALAGSAVAVATDVLPIVDTSVTTSKKIAVDNLLGAMFTTAGDIAQASAAGVAARLAIGTAGQVPAVNAGATALAYKTLITLATSQATTSGTTPFDFTGIPAGTKRIKIFFVGVATNSGGADDDFFVQLGDAGGFEATGYVGGCSTIISTVSANVNTTTAFRIGSSNTWGNGVPVHGTVTLDLVVAASFTWACSGIINASGVAISASLSGTKSLSAELTQVRITTASGDNTYSLGLLNISYE